jgi:septum formation inhibitor-activating ATPase MinD
VTQVNRLIDRLRDADIDFVIVGGFAGVLHGSTLVTRDLDVCAVLTPESVSKLRVALGDLKPRTGKHPNGCLFATDARRRGR